MYLIRFELLQLRSYGGCDLTSVKSPVFDEDFIRVHPGDDHTRQIDSGTGTLQGIRVGARALCLRIQSDSGGVQELEVRLVANECKDKVILQVTFAFGSGNANGLRQDFQDL